MKSFIFYPPPLSPRRGGPISLHYLCHLINEAGGEAYILKNHPDQLDGDRTFAPYNIKSPSVLKNNGAKYNRKKDIVIYPEITCGNPAGAANVVRWLLYYEQGHNKEEGME